MSKAKKKAGRPTREITSQVKSNLRHHDCEAHWGPNKYVSAVLKDVGIAALFFAAVYATAVYLGQPVTTEIATSEKPRTSRPSEHKTAHASVIEEQPKKVSKNATATIVTGTTAFVSGNNVLIRENSTLSAKVLGKAIFGTSVDITASDGKWIQINSPVQNLSGWTERASLNF